MASITSDPSSNYSHQSTPPPHPPKSTKSTTAIPTFSDPTALEHTSTAISSNDLPPATYVATGDNDIIYNKFSPARKLAIVIVMSFCGFLAPISSTTVLSAVPEVAATFGCDGTIINLSNAIYMLFMGLSPMFWGPVCTVYGRRWVGVPVFSQFSCGSCFMQSTGTTYLLETKLGHAF
jgi:hypothetical protein